MNELKIFENPEFGKIRTVAIDGEPWLVGKDVARVLGYGDTDQALRKHVDDEDKLTRRFDGEPRAKGGNPNMVIINESGLYALVLSSKLPKAKQFKRWVTSEVLPSIRKTGGYTLPQAQGVAPEVTHVLTELTKTQLATAETMRRLSERITTLERFKPKEIKVIQRAEPEVSLSGLASLANAARKATLDMGGSQWDAGVEVFRICSKYGIPIPPWAKSECKKNIGLIELEDFF